jgi:F-type H+-transporting ATPase subunit a
VHSVSISNLSTDDEVLWRSGFVVLNYTILYTWLVMGLIVVASWLATQRLSSRPEMSRWQNFMEIIVGAINNQIREVSRQEPERYLPFIGTLFIFIVTCNLLAVVPGFQTPTASLSTTAALAIGVLVAVPVYG